MEETKTFLQRIFETLSTLFETFSTIEPLIFIVFAATATIIASRSLSYLQGRNRSNWTNDKEITLLREETNKLASQIRRQSQLANTPTIPEGDWEKIKSEAVSQSISNLTKETREQMQTLFRQKSSDGLRKQLFERMMNQLSALERRADFSLVLGMIFSISGLVVLYFSFFLSPPTSSSLELLPSLLSYAPRLSLILIIEAVAFFFLRLYSKAIDEIRYTQNEITNVEMKILGLDESLLNNSTKSMANALKALSETERNYILKSGETTADIEQAKIIGATIASGKDGLLKRFFSQSEQ